MDRPLRLISSNPLDQLARTLEALLVVASAPLPVEELAAAADDDPERIETALGLLGERYREGRSGIVLEHVAGGYAFRAAREAAEACGEFLVLVAALLELKARGLFPDEDAELAEVEPEEATEELARRLALYRRAKRGAELLAELLDGAGDRYFRLGPSPFAPRVERRLAPQDPASLADALRRLAADPPAVSLAHMELRFPPVGRFLERFRAVLARRRRFDFDAEVSGLSRVE